MPQTDKRSIITQALIDWLADWTQPGSTQKVLSSVYYGDEELVPHTPAISVEPGLLEKDFVGAQYVTNNSYTALLTIYYMRQGSIGANRKAADEFAERVEDRIHENRTMSGLVYSGLVNVVDSGFITKGNNAVYIGNQMQWSARSKTRLNYG